MKALREAAALRLGELPDLADATSDNDGALCALHIERVTCEVQCGRQSELVSLRLSHGVVQAVCSCGQPDCGHVRVALQLMAAWGEARTGPDRAEVSPEAEHEEPAAVHALTPVGAGQLAEALADIVTAVVRSGVRSDRIASVRETLERVERAAPKPLPLGLLRWLGRVHEALDAQDTALAAQALSAAATFARDLRSARTSTEAARSTEAALRLASWLGPAPATSLQRISDRTLVEVAREWVDGTTRKQIERRYLVDLDSGECFREEHLRGASSSIGSCPRLVGVSLAEVHAGCSPRRVRLLQYTTTPELARAHWDNLAAWGQRDSAALLSAYRSEVAQYGALAEPFALTAPRSLQREGRLSLVLDRGAPLPLVDDDEPGVLRYCELILRAATLVWVAGRLVEREGQLMLRPLSLGVLDAATHRHERL